MKKLKPKNDPHIYANMHILLKVACTTASRLHATLGNRTDYKYLLVALSHAM